MQIIVLFLEAHHLSSFNLIFLSARTSDPSHMKLKSKFPFMLYAPALSNTNVVSSTSLFGYGFPFVSPISSRIFNPSSRGTSPPSDAFRETNQNNLVEIPSSTRQSPPIHPQNAVMLRSYLSQSPPLSLPMSPKDRESYLRNDTLASYSETRL